MSTYPVCYGIIPARYESSRFPGKPLAPILGKPMFRHVYERASSCPLLAKVALATDDRRIFEAAEAAGVPVVMTRADHASGTDRVLEAADILGVPDDAVVVNIQGDEPCLDPDMLSQLLCPFEDPSVRAATLCSELAVDDAHSPDRVKVVRDLYGRALYFSRAPIPFARDGVPPGGASGYMLHIGLYAFRMETLRTFAALPPSPLERRERLEQLRLLENGIPIHVVETEHTCHGVDRPEDIHHVTDILERSE